MTQNISTSTKRLLTFEEFLAYEEDNVWGLLNIS